MKATTVNLTVNGKVYSYPGNPYPSFYVTFQADGNVNFHYGALHLDDLTIAEWGHGDPNVAYVVPMPSYHASILDETGASMLERDVSCHWWNAEWTFRVTPLTAMRTPAQLYALGLMFPFGNTGNPDNKVLNYQYTGPMDTAGVVIDMGTTGERPDLGMVTDPEALFLLGGPAGPMLAWAEANGSCPIHFRDELDGGKVIDKIKYPAANDYLPAGRQGYPFIAQGPDRGDGWHVYQGAWGPVTSHFCDMSYVACVATMDERLLWNVQANANFVLVSDASLSGTSAGAILNSEYRGVAWGLGLLLKAYMATKDFENRNVLPSYCRPSSYFLQLLTQSLSYYRAQSQIGTAATFGFLVPNGRIALWQHVYVMTVLSLGMLGAVPAPDLLPNYLHGLKNVVDRTSNKPGVGFPPALGVDDYVNVKLMGDDTQPAFPDWQTVLAHIDDLPLDVQGRGPMAPTVAKLLASDGMNGGQLIMGWQYFWGDYAVMVMADDLDNKGLAPVRATFPEFDQALANTTTLFLSTKQDDARLSVVMDGTASALSPDQIAALLDPTPIIVHPQGAPAASSPTPAPVPAPAPEPTPQPQPPGVKSMADPLASLTAAVAQIKADVAAEISAIHARISAIIAAATTSGTTVDPAELQAQVDALGALHTQLTTDTAAIPTATA